MENYDQAIAAHRRRRMIIAAGAAAAVVAVIIIAAVYYRLRVFEGYTVEEEQEIGQQGSYRYATFGEYLLRYNQDGITCLEDMKQVWNQAYEMKNPIMDVCGSYAAVGEQKSNTVYVMNEEGLQGQIEMQYPIVKLEVADQGVVAALEEDGESNYIEVRDKDGNSLIAGKTVLDGNGYPLDFSLSEDGTKMVVSYICINGGQAETKVLFYNFSDIGQNEVDRMVGGFNHYTTSVVPEVEFVNNRTAVAFGSNIITFYSMKNKPEIIAEETFTEEIKKVFYSESYVGMVFYNSSSDAPFELVVYDLDGDEVLKTTYEKEYDEVLFDGDTVILYDDFSCRVLTLGGREKFNYTFAEEVEAIVPAKGSYSYYLVGSNTMQRIELK